LKPTWFQEIDEVGEGVVEEEWPFVVIVGEVFGRTAKVSGWPDP
jgi:hypothetical protein